MSIVENIKAGGGVVLQAERLQPPVERCFTRYDVNGRLTGSIGNREIIAPFIRSVVRCVSPSMRHGYSLDLLSI